MFLILAFILSWVIVIFGIAIFLHNPRNKINRVFLFLALSSAFWVIANFIVDYTQDLELALIFSKLAIIGPVFLAPIILYFSFIFPKEKKKISSGKVLLMFLPTLFFLVLSPTDLNVREVSLEEWGIDFRPGVLYYFLIGYFIVYLTLAFRNFIKAYQENKGIERMQIRYFFTGVASLFFIGVITNAILPLFGYGQLLTIGPSLSMLVFLSFISYTITRYRLMDIQVALGRSAVYLFSFLTVIGLALLLMYLNGLLVQPLSDHAFLPLALILCVLSYQYLILPFFEKIASRHFYYTFYSYQWVLTDVGKSLTRILDLKKLALFLTNSLIETMKLDRTVVLLRNPETGHYRIYSNIGFREENGISLVKDNFLTAYLEKTKKPLVYEELFLIIRDTVDQQEKESLENLKANMKRIEASLCLPLLMEEKIIGLIVLGNKISKEPYSAQDIDLLTALSNQASIALNNAYLYNRVQDLSQNLQQKVQEQTKEIRKAYEVEKQAHQELKKLNLAKDQFLLSIQHHLRTPLTPIRGYLEMILSGAYNQKKTKEKLKFMKKSADNLHDLMENLLDIQAMRIGKEILDLKEIDLEDLISGVIGELEHEMKEKDLQIVFKKESLPKIKLDQKKIREVVWNLIDNAVKYTDKGKISIELTSKNNKATIKVTDTGIGMTQGEIDYFSEGKLFERGEEAKKRYGPGRGIGLAICLEFIKAHRGKIWVESKGRGKGSSFFVELPLK